MCVLVWRQRIHHQPQRHGIVGMWIHFAFHSTCDLCVSLLLLRVLLLYPNDVTVIAQALWERKTCYNFVVRLLTFVCFHAFVFCFYSFCWAQSKMPGNVRKTWWRVSHFAAFPSAFCACVYTALCSGPWLACNYASITIRRITCHERFLPRISEDIELKSWI